MAKRERQPDFLFRTVCATLRQGRYLLRDENGTVEVAHDRHIMGLFPRAEWLELIADAGFEPLAVPFKLPSEVKASFDMDYPTMGGVSDVLATIAKSGFSLIGHFPLPNEAWWDDFYTPMQHRIAELRGKYADDGEALAILDQLAQEPEMYRKYSDYYAYEFFVVRRNG